MYQECDLSLKIATLFVVPKVFHTTNFLQLRQLTMDKEPSKPGGGGESSPHASTSTSTPRPGAYRVEGTIDNTTPSSISKPTMPTSPRKSKGSGADTVSPTKDNASATGSMTFRQLRLSQTAASELADDDDEDSKSASSSPSSNDPLLTTPGAVRQSVTNSGIDDKFDSVLPPPIAATGEDNFDVEAAVTLTASVVDENAPTAQDIQDIKKQISFLAKQSSTATDTPINPSITVAEQVEKDDDGQRSVEDGGSFWKSCSKTKVLLVFLLVVLIAVGAGVGAAVAGGGSSSSSSEETERDDIDDVVEPAVSFDLVAPVIDGREPDLNFGSSLALSSDGNRMIVADDIAITIYDLVDGIWNQVGEPVIPDDCGEKMPRGGIDEFIRSTIVVDLSEEGDIFAVGCPFATGFNDTLLAGKVQTYFLNGGNVEKLGEPILGEMQDGYLGGSVSLDSDGSFLVVGGPGAAGLAQVYSFSLGEWNRRGNGIVSEALGLSVDSVSLSLTGDVLAVGGVPVAGQSVVVRVYEFFTGDWREVGRGVSGDLEQTAYMVALSGDGQTIAVSNYYLGVSGLAQGEQNDALDVRAFQFNSNSGDWELLGSNLHAFAPGVKSGYFVTLSDDGLIMGMGDPGRQVDDGSVTGHSHIYYFTGEEWIQVGPNMDGEAAGDQNGYSVRISGDGTRFAVSAPSNRGRGFEFGRVYVYDIDTEPYLVD